LVRRLQPKPSHLVETTIHSDKAQKSEGGEWRPMPSPNFFLLIGKPVGDEYGRQVGKIVSLAVTPNGRIDGVFVEHVDGDFSRYSKKRFRVEGDSVTLLPFAKLKVKTLCDQIPLIWRKDQALSDLFEKKKIPSDNYDVLHKNFEGVLNQLKADAQATIHNIDKQTVKCDQQIKELNSALVHLEIEREIGRIDDKNYQTSIQVIQEGLKRIHAEKDDLESMRKQLSNILLGDKPITQEETEKELPTVYPAATQPLVPQELPEPPHVVHVKIEANPAS